MVNNPYPNPGQHPSTLKNGHIDIIDQKRGIKFMEIKTINYLKKEFVDYDDFVVSRCNHLDDEENYVELSAYFRRLN